MVARFVRSGSLLCLGVLWLSGCAQDFSRPDTLPYTADGPDGPTLFEQSFAAHGGEQIMALQNLNVGMDGKWRFLIKRIQPLVTDYTYRVVSQERILPNEKVYTALYEGPGGTKKVVRGPDSVRVFYNNVESFDNDVLQSTALTADAFFVFSLGPMALRDASDDFVRLADIDYEGKRYQRIYAVLEPGFGYAERDEIVLWLDPQTHLTKRVVITLEGFENTKGAHVDVEFLAFTRRDGFVLPSRFHERVLAPIKIHAHAWHLTGLDINRDYGVKAINGSGYVRGAEPAAATLN